MTDQLYAAARMRRAIRPGNDGVRPLLISPAKRSRTRRPRAAVYRWPILPGNRASWAPSIRPSARSVNVFVTGKLVTSALQRLDRVSLMTTAGRRACCFARGLGIGDQDHEVPLVRGIVQRRPRFLAGQSPHAQLFRWGLARRLGDQFLPAESLQHDTRGFYDDASSWTAALTGAPVRIWASSRLPSCIADPGCFRVSRTLVNTAYAC